ncbi:MAG: YigZ family protein [Spirochaetes bacterium]|uniref:YigZ family protein n=1 Tax=Candidatus Ornithospirochaeta stercoripullorum TaxID=2840899 RepID=A0A9D9E2B0_9SPIO|nr:YigZ family protein [Candidatus Ornithospirochaeta stercoripullorum]
MLIPTARSEAEIEVKRSRFIAIAIPTFSMEEVKEAVLSVRKEHPDATHVVHASVIGKAGTMYSSSDDREPKNTAGRPALEVVKGSGITNITVAIVRYFGGTLLGTGGLVKAYSDSAKAVLAIVPTEELIEKTEFSMTLPYNSYTLIKRLLESVSAEILKENFDINIKIEGRIPSSNLATMEAEAMDIGQGKILLSIST